MTGKRRKKKVLVDADVLIDFYFRHSEFEESFKKFAKMRESQQFELYALSKCLQRVYYECGETAGDNACLMMSEIIGTKDNIKDKACKSHLVDFDSAEEVMYAKDSDLDAIITLNPRNFDGADLEIISLRSEGDKLRKHLTKVIFGSLALFSIGIICGLYIPGIYFQMLVKLNRYPTMRLTEEDMKKSCMEEFMIDVISKNHGVLLLKNNYNKKGGEGWKIEKATLEITPQFFVFPQLLYTLLNNTTETLPVFSAQCQYTIHINGQGKSVEGRSYNEGLHLDEYCEKYSKGKGNKATYFNIFAPYSFYCVPSNRSMVRASQSSLTQGIRRI